ncbi:MAG: hypothetical protein KA341_16660 [Saprospiraceae bacterium]|nr:hypothetical protein [Saprospiraceae bacterium]
MRIFILFLFILCIHFYNLSGQLVIDYETLSIRDIDPSKFVVGKFINVKIENYCDTCDKFTVEISGEQHENTSGIDAFKKMNSDNKVVRDTGNYFLLSFQVPDKDKSIIKIMRYDSSGKVKIEQRSFFFRNRGGLKFDVSSGFFVSNLRNETYGLKTVNAENKQIVLENNGDIRVGIGLLAHLHCRSQKWLSGGFTGGFEVNNDAKIGFLAGGSLLFGYDRKFIISGGAAFGKVKRISKLYSVGENVPASVNEVPTVEIWKMGLFIALTYNF